MTDEKPTKLEIRLYDAIEYLLCELYADGIDRRGENKANTALGAFHKLYGVSRHDGKWVTDPMGEATGMIKDLVKEK